MKECAKCGRCRIDGPRYRKASLYPIGFKSHESLVYTCLTCGYEWREPTLDAPPRTDGERLVRAAMSEREGGK